MAYIDVANARRALLTAGTDGHNIMAMSRRPRKAEVGAAAFKARCLELVDRVKETRTEYIVTRHGRPVARLVPAETAAAATPLGAMQGTLIAYERPFEPIAGAWEINAGNER